MPNLSVEAGRGDRGGHITLAETAKIRSLYPKPHGDPLGLKRVVDNHLPEDDIFEAMWRATWMETGRGNHSPEDDTKSGKRQWKPFTETPVPEKT
ncbi:hypothetical protein B9Z55_023123 [Caenorhabditis nigoni]|uniref:Uncharacterized protein n=1 Tax=Caenorhabditis nigoni TaxID=1611254 RepID=A0A2G5SN44_9PELO|nr:hypothetical protein B9Z55_023123 [Caenorhabditis nigoni]